MSKSWIWPVNGVLYTHSKTEHHLKCLVFRIPNIFRNTKKYITVFYLWNTGLIMSFSKLLIRFWSPSITIQTTPNPQFQRHQIQVVRTCMFSNQVVYTCFYPTPHPAHHPCTTPPAPPCTDDMHHSPCTAQLAQPKCHAPHMHRCHARPSLPVNQNTNPARTKPVDIRTTSYCFCFNLKKFRQKIVGHKYQVTLQIWLHSLNSFNLIKKV